MDLRTPARSTSQSEGRPTLRRQAAAPERLPNSKGTAYCDFDAFGRPGRIVAADGSLTRLDYQGARLVLRTRRVWDGEKEVGGTTREEYDSLGRLRRIREPNKIEPNGKQTDGTWTYYWYDMGGRLSSVTANATKAQQQTRTFHYDGRGFLDREVQPESGTVSYEYDAQGNVTKKMTPTGTILYAHDTAGRLMQVGTPQAPLRLFSYLADGSAKGKLEWARAFNDRPVGSSCLRFEVRQDFTYNDLHGRLETEKTSLFQGGSPLEKWTQGYTYDGAGQVTRVDYPACLGGCSAATRSQTFTYSMGRLIQIPGFTKSTSQITYNDNGLVKQITHANGVIFTQTPDSEGMARPGTLGTNRDWQSESYQFDASGNIKKIGTKTFSYDPSSRLTSATIPSVTQPYRGYKYDTFGNLTEVSQGASAGNIATYVSYTPNPATNQLQGAGYDASGRLFSYQGSTYSWDVLNNVTKVNTGSEEWIHTYDVAGERVWSWRTSSTRKDTYALRGLDGKILTDFTKEGGAYSWEDYVYREGQLLAARFSDGRTAHFDVDHLGSVRQETDASGAVIKYREFWPYGEEATAPSGTEQMKFTGHERDLGVPTSTADDLDYMHARYYKPLFARFLSPDPNVGSAHAPQTWNRYSYVAGNPLRFADPTGRYLCLSDTSKCDAFEKARQGLLTRKDPEIVAAAGSYGDRGVDNGITVVFGDPGNNKAATTDFDFHATPDATAIEADSKVTVKPDLKGVHLAAAIAHEGSHLLDAKALAASFTMDPLSYDKSLNLTLYDTEFKAYHLTDIVYRSYGKQFKGTCDGCILGATPEIPAAIDQIIKRIIADPSGPYKVTPANPGPRLIEWPGLP